ncbi:nadp:d-xylose dehydrogenase [Fusarium austroafricanum]|uniref:Nadp:d-xylose dehydrogenase n=1 Tax=Fusarium austroafricanum TaxID=2364996 RepID=A0A8H4KB10_9HYPO|nr:nadp:d-xylose dehydrogenase [Fusarium austroafricanum]
MSFGFSIGDFFLLSKTAWDTLRLLSGEAVHEFRRFESIYRDLVSLYKYIRPILQDPEYETLFPRQVERLKELLGEFRDDIRELKPQLGRHRGRTSLRGIVQMIRWPVHSQSFEKLFRDIMFQIKIIGVKRQFWHGSARNPLEEQFFFRNSFSLEDPCGELHRQVDFFSVSSWGQLHEFLLRVFPSEHPGHRVIQDHRYVIHKSDSEVEILCNSPGLKPLQEVIQRQELIRMSVIFPMREQYESKCPKCRRLRQANFQGPSLTCRCGLWLRFHDSFDDEPDPLTRIALQNIKSSGKAEFVARVEARHNAGPTRNSTRQSSCVSYAIDKLDSNGPITSPSVESHVIENFRRVTLCNPQWPDPRPSKSEREAMGMLRTIISGLERTRDYFGAEDFPFAQVAALLNSRAWNAREDQAVARFVRMCLEALRQKASLARSTNIISLMDLYVEEAREHLAEFQTVALETRCLLWMYQEARQLEAQILRSCAELLDRWSLPQGFTREKTPLFVKLLFSPHIILLAPLRGFDIIMDVGESFITKPKYLPGAIKHLITSSEDISLHFYIHDGLKDYSQPAMRTGAGETTSNDGITAESRQWMEEAMQSKGQTIKARKTQVELRKLMSGGHI